ncbi:MAG: MFS transporter [Bacillota bacterium]|nr:MFS transporter [Bacillota bacterium]
MSNTSNYKITLKACYLGFITQSIVCNFASLLFIRFHEEFSISLGTIALIPTIFFLTQIMIDLFCAKFVDRIGYRKCVVASEVLASIGLIGLAVLPNYFSNPFTGVLVSVVIYAAGSGLIEVLVSPIVEACPFENKESVMSLLHSFYCWGVVGVILISTLFFKFFGIENWRIYNFATCPIERLTNEGQGLKANELLKQPKFWVSIILMICAGASELAMAQWASAYVEAALHLSKALGDLVGPCLFAVAMGICRVFYGKYGEKLNLINFMMGSGALCLICYLLVAFSNSSVLGLIGCILCGFSVAIMWPDTISISSKQIPLGGTAMFALLAMSGDLGGTIGPAIVGIVSENANSNLKSGLLMGSIFPIILIISLLFLKRNSKDK